MEFEWDARKAPRNVNKHKVSFEEAATVFADWKSRTIPDPTHSLGEGRYLTLGYRIVAEFLLSRIPTGSGESG